MLADLSGTEGLGFLTGAGIFFAFGKKGELLRLLAKAATRKAALEGRTTALCRLVVLLIARRAGGRVGVSGTSHCRGTTSATATTAKQGLLQRLPGRLGAEHSELDG